MQQADTDIAVKRVVKYQAWHQYQMCMFEVVALTWHAAIVRKFSAMTLVSLDGTYSVRNVTGAACDSYILRQFTGLIDRLGKEIFEGDILFLRLGKHRLEVRWSVMGFRLFDLDAKGWYLLWAADMKRLEVVGNIYEARVEVA